MSAERFSLNRTKCDSQTICTSCQVILKHKGCKCHDRQQNSKIMREDLHQSMSNRRSSSRRIKGGCASKRRC
ncbi:uncharacterized protein L201_000867 [Kwoniella dendrophila CBS 6074]|uniref:Copper-fist domain-containing protein n=1 Tax=Kwoniella dendrophila CBS 6074 TaxID=1295534 RepID=A0AAX4JKR5_9TREE